MGSGVSDLRYHKKQKQITTGICVLNGLLWFVVQSTNTAVLDWRANPMRFSLRDRHTWRRHATQEIPLSTLTRREPLLIRSDSSATLCYALAPAFLPGTKPSPSNTANAPATGE